MSSRRELEHRRQELHAQMRELVHVPLMRGSIVERRRRCGRARCACATDDAARHAGKYLSVHLGGRTRVVHLRAEDEDRVRAAIEAYERVWKIIDGLTTCELAQLRRDARERARTRSNRGG
jgi:hypothetical protein